MPQSRSTVSHLAARVMVVKTVIPVGSSPEQIHARVLDSRTRCEAQLLQEWGQYMEELAADNWPMPPQRAAPSGQDIDKYNYMLPSRIQPWYRAVAALPHDAYGVHRAAPGFPALPLATYGTFKGIYLCTFESLEVMDLFCDYASMDIAVEHAPSWMWAEQGHS